MSNALDSKLTTSPLWPLPDRREKGEQARRWPGGMTPRDRERVLRAGYRAGYSWHVPSYDNPYLESTIWHQTWAEGYEQGRKAGVA